MTENFQMIFDRRIIQRAGCVSSCLVVIYTSKNTVLCMAYYDDTYWKYFKKKFTHLLLPCFSGRGTYFPRAVLIIINFVLCGDFKCCRFEARHSPF